MIRTLDIRGSNGDQQKIQLRSATGEIGILHDGHAIYVFEDDVAKLTKALTDFLTAVRLSKDTTRRVGPAVPGS